MQKTCGLGHVNKQYKQYTQAKKYIFLTWNLELGFESYDLFWALHCLQWRVLSLVLQLEHFYNTRIILVK